MTLLLHVLRQTWRTLTARVCDPDGDNGGHQFAVYEPGAHCYCGKATVQS